MGFDFRRSVIGLEKPLQLLDEYEKQIWKPRDLVIRVFPHSWSCDIFLRYNWSFSLLHRGAL